MEDTRRMLIVLFSSVFSASLAPPVSPQAALHISRLSSNPWQEIANIIPPTDVEAISDYII